MLVLDLVDVLLDRRGAMLTAQVCHLVDPLDTARHTHITIALTEGVPVHVVAARAGDRPEQNLRTYAHLLPHLDAEAAAVVAAAIAPDVSLTTG